MTKKTNTDKKQPTVKVGNITNVSGNINIASGNIITHQTTSELSVSYIKQLFEQLYPAIEALTNISALNMTDIKGEVEKIQLTVTEAVENEKKVDENFLVRRFRNIARVAPDALDVVVATLGNPLAGLGIAVKKIAEKAKEETR